MSDYNRSTREVSFENLEPAIQTAVEQYIVEHELGDVLADIQFCCETVNEKKKKRGLFGGRGPDPDPVHMVATIVTTHYLIWARHGEKFGTVVKLIELSQIEMREYQYAHMIEDTGINVFGFIGNMAEKSELFIGLGTDPAADDFRDATQTAIRKAKGQRDA